MSASPTDSLDASKEESTERQNAAVEALMQKKIPRKRNLLNHDPTMLHGASSPPEHDAEAEQGHPDPFADALDDSRMSDDFMSWHMTGSFAEDEDSRSNFKIDAPAAWHEPLWQPTDPPLRNVLTEHQLKHSPEKAHKKSRKVFHSSPSSSKPRRSPLQTAPHTPLFASCGSFGMGTPIAQLQFDNVFSPLPETNKHLQISPPTRRVLLHHRNANLPAPSPMHRAHGTSGASPLKKASVMDSESTLEGPSTSARNQRGNGAVSPERLHQPTQPPITPASMKVTLGQSTPNPFENINTKLKANPSLPKTPEKKSCTVPSDEQTAEDFESCFPPYVDAGYHHHPFMSHQYYHHERHIQPAPPPFFLGYEAHRSLTHKRIAPPHTKQRKLPSTGAVTATPALNNTTTVSANKEKDSASSERHTLRSSPPVPVSTTTVAATGNDKENEKSGSRDLKSGERVTCNCKKSRCLKLYCDCFSQEQYCEGCKCEDCHNIPSHASLRDQVMREVLSKNPKAFKPRIDIQSHNMGCRCKKSECLKKYCECFEARVLCTNKCKCTGCLNHAGSQQLIDKRRKMKDVIGAQFAMEVSDMKWKSQCPSRPPLPSSKSSGPILSRASPPSQALLGHPTMVTSPSPNLRPPYPSHYMGAMNGPYGYYPMPAPMPYSTPHHGHGLARSHYDYAYQPPHHSPFWAPTNPGTTPTTQWSHHRTITPSAGASSATNKRSENPTPQDGRSVKVRLNQTRNRAMTRGSFFGSENPAMDTIIVAAVFQFLSAGDKAKVHVVCKQWNVVAKHST